MTVALPALPLLDGALASLALAALRTLALRLRVRRGRRGLLSQAHPSGEQHVLTAVRVLGREHPSHGRRVRIRPASSGIGERRRDGEAADRRQDQGTSERSGHSGPPRFRRYCHGRLPRDSARRDQRCKYIGESESSKGRIFFYALMTALFG